MIIARRKGLAMKDDFYAPKKIEKILKDCIEADLCAVVLVGYEKNELHYRLCSDMPKEELIDILTNVITYMRE